MFDPHTYGDTLEPAQRYANIEARKRGRQIIHRLDQTHVLTDATGHDVSFRYWVRGRLDRLVNRILLRTQEHPPADICPKSFRFQLLAVYEEEENPFITRSPPEESKSYEIRKIDPPAREWIEYSAFDVLCDFFKPMSSL
jgi:hypothetical protein